MSDNEKKFSVVNKIFGIGAVVLSAAAAVVYLCLNIFFSTGKFSLAVSLIWLIFSIIILLRSKRRFVFVLSIAGCVAAVSLLLIMTMLAPVITSDSPWKYNLQQQYVGLYNENSFENFPDALPENIDDYRFEYKPAIMQGSGHSSVRFTGSAEVIRAYEREYASQAIYAIPLSRFDHGDTSVETVSPKARVPYEGDKHLSVYVDEDFWGDTEATVYVLSATHNFNHPRSSAVIISSDYSKIQFSRF